MAVTSNCDIDGPMSTGVGTVRARRARLAASTLLALLACALIAHATAARADTEGEPSGRPQAAPYSLAGIDSLVADSIARGQLPGCVVLVGRQGGILYEKAFGHRAVLPEKEPMTVDTIFDVASLTKPVATATVLMQLAERGQVDLDAPAVRYVPELGKRGKSAITLRQLLTHVSGLPAETPVSDFERGRAVALKRIFKLPLKAAPGAKLIYSDVGFLVLEEVIRRVTGKDLATLSATMVFQPLGMQDTGFLPKTDRRPRIAPTEMRGETWMRGDVHDPRAFRLGGVAGHAGLFSTARDLALYARMVLGLGSLAGTRVLSAESMVKMLAAHDVPGAIRALGWDMQSGYSANRGTLLSRRAVGHGGYTGTSLWIDPGQDLFVVFLSNRVHPNGKGAINALAGSIATLAAAATGGVPSTKPDGRPLAVGIDALVAQGFAPLRGLRVALLTNDSARTRDGRRTTDVLAESNAMRVVALLSPEHGLGANHEDRIEDGIDTRTRIPILSLYGGRHGPRSKPPAGPRPVTLPGDLDGVVVDLPDVGARFFTYASTMHATMRAAAERGLRLFVLDRPNPINGVDLAGPLLKPSEHSPVNHHPLPIRHAMTMGELAEMMNADEHLGLRLEVVRMPAYDRRAYFDQTGLTWSAPSPNLRTVEQVVLYPGVALVESTNVSVGRGTETPFEVVGAPWLEGQKLAAELARFGLAGVAFEATSFTPKANPYRGQHCGGIRLRITDRAAFDPVRTGLAVAVALRRLHRDAWDGSRLRRTLGDPAVAASILSGRELADIEAMARVGLESFEAKRKKYLLYPP